MKQYILLLLLYLSIVAPAPIFSETVDVNLVAAEEKEFTNFINKHGKAILAKYRLPKDQDLSYWGSDRNVYFYKYPALTYSDKAPYWTNGHFNGDDTLDYIYIV